MATPKQDKDKIPVEPTTSTEGVILGLFTQVAKRQISMPDAEKKLHAHIDGLPDVERAEVREKAVAWGRFLHSVADAFMQELTIAGSKQD